MKKIYILSSGDCSDYQIEDFIRCDEIVPGDNAAFEQWKKNANSAAIEWRRQEKEFVATLPEFTGKRWIQREHPLDPDMTEEYAKYLDDQRERMRIYRAVNPPIYWVETTLAEFLMRFKNGEKIGYEELHDGRIEYK